MERFMIISKRETSRKYKSENESGYRPYIAKYCTIYFEGEKVCIKEGIRTLKFGNDIEKAKKYKTYRKAREEYWRIYREYPTITRVLGIKLIGVESDLEGEPIYEKD